MFGHHQAIVRLAFCAFLVIFSGFLSEGLLDSLGRKPLPDIDSARYGPYPRNILDVWLADGPRAPALVYFHGGGFCGGDKRDVPTELIRGCKKAGITLISANYRLSQQAPFPAPMTDGARALQFVRSQSADWNIDPDRIGLAGGSAGAGIALWVAFHDDLAQPEADDPVARQSTRVSCVAVVGAQSSYDPNEIRDWIGGRAWEHPALPPFLGVSPNELSSARVRPLLREASPIHHVSAGDPPVWMYYLEPGAPLPEGSPPGKGIHHPIFGWKLKERMESLGISCEVRTIETEGRDGERLGPEFGMVEYLRRQLTHSSIPSSLAHLDR